MIELNNNGVVFDEDLHEYWLDSKKLNGITRAISKYIHPQKYDSVSESVLMSATERGHAVHSAIELYCSLGMRNDSIPELDDFINIKEENEIETVANEYIVTDHEFYASPIDYVCKTPDCDDNEVCIIDFKSTSSIDEMRLNVQLTIYKMFFEENNPGLKVKHIGCIWLPKQEYGKPKIIWTDGVDEELAQMLLDAYRTETEFNAVEITREFPLPVAIGNIEKRVCNIVSIGKSIDAYLKEMKKSLLEEMVKNNVKSYKGDNLTISLTKGYAKSGGYDNKALLAVIDELLDSCPDKSREEMRLKVEACKKPDTFVSDSVTIKVS